MPDIRIHRDHDLGLAKAREIAWQWAEEVEKKFDMACTVVEGKTHDTVEFTRTGVSGQLVVAADYFDLHAKLGFLLGAFAKTIEGEILKNLDTLLGAAGKARAKTAAPKAAASKTTASKTTATKTADRGAPAKTAAAKETPARKTARK